MKEDISNINNKWYDLSPLLTRNGLFNFTLGNRSIGKSYGFKKWCINDFKKDANQFMYVVRYKTDLKDISTFFDDLMKNGEYKKDKLEVRGTKFFINEKISGFAVALSDIQKLKKMSFPYVTKIIFDEFIIEGGTNHYYLPNEPEKFLNLFHTVKRDRNNLRAFFIANAISMINPYFIYFDIKNLSKDKRFYRFNKHIIVEYVENKIITEQEEQTAFGEVIKNTNYGNYALKNEFVLDIKEFIEEKPPNAKYQFNILYKAKNIGVWIDFKTDIIYFDFKGNSSTITLSVLSTDHNKNTIALSYNNYYKSLLKASYEKALLRYKNIQVKNSVYEILKFMYIVKK